MGAETALIMGAVTAATSAAGAFAQAGAARKEAKALVAQGNVAAQQKAKSVRAKAAKAQVSFLNSGLLLQGTPQNAIMNIFDTGIDDINQIRTNANLAAKNKISAGRSQLISSLLTTATSFAASSLIPTPTTTLGGAATSPTSQIGLSTNKFFSTPFTNSPIA